eukprot:TRINITY_DN7922_c0_g2_i4.p1 TRINITY_DN7922_c0_g2~~TRINITY_DN7922_c0_g2_i4.p1  ORF type:complete len:1489 (-),score=439.35 TRINITY_DN7922_c0_g2_i4:127-4593(-)
MITSRASVNSNISSSTESDVSLRSSSSPPITPRKVTLRSGGKSEIRGTLQGLRNNADPSIVALDLQKGTINFKEAKNLGEALSTNTTLEILNLKGNPIGTKGVAEIANRIISNKNLGLVELNLSSGNLEATGACILLQALLGNTSIKNLSLDDNKITKACGNYIAALLKQNHALRQFSLSNNPKIGKSGGDLIFDGLKFNRDLNDLQISNIGLSKRGAVNFSTVMKYNSSLTSLDISRNAILDEGMIRLCEALQDNKALQTLRVCSNKITRKSANAVVDALLKPDNALRSLDLSYNNVGVKGAVALANGLSRNTTLTALGLCHTGIKTEGFSALVSVISTNVHLTFIELSRNGISNKGAPLLLSLIKSNRALQTIAINNNSLGKDLKGLEDSLMMNKSLTSLFLSSNPVGTKIGLEIAAALPHNKTLQLLELKESGIGGKGMEALLEAYQVSVTLVSACVNGVVFTRKQINGQGLIRFPLPLLQMHHLKALDLSDNHLEELPPRISELKNLRELNVSKNDLQSLPYTLAFMEHLRLLLVDDNPLRVPPREIVRKGRKEILLFLKDLAEGNEPLYRVKLLVVGQENVGKTTLIRKLNSKKKVDAKKRAVNASVSTISTDGIDIDEWQMHVDFADNKNQPVNFSIWDFAGQELYYASHQFFLSDRSIYIVVFDLRFGEEESRVEFWLQSINARAPNAPILILGTHADDKKCTGTPGYVEEQLQSLRDKYMKRFKNIAQVVAADVTKSVKQIKKSLKDMTAQHKIMGELMPQSYLELEKLIIEERKTKNIVGWPYLLKLGAVANLNDSGAILRAVKMLHELGSVVYFDDKNSGLSDCVILNPQFITDLLATIITTKHKFVKEGIIHHRDLDQIWREPEFPKELHSSYLALMERFEVSYNINSQTKANEAIDPSAKSLIPSLLPEVSSLDLRSSDLWTNYGNAPQMERHYRLEFIPSGIFSRLMIRMFRYASRVHTFWKYGAMMVKDADVILLELFPETKTLCVAIRGERAVPIARVIVETVSSLIHKWYHINVFEVAPCPSCLRSEKGNPHIFDIEECTMAIAEGRTTMKCDVENVEIPVAIIAPDIAMIDLESKKINLSVLKIGKEIGRGAFGLINEAQFEGKSVAVKRLLLQEDPELADMKENINTFNEFRREVFLMSQMVHPNVVNLVGFTLSPITMVMEKVSEGNLYTILHDDKKSLSWPLRFRIAVDIAHGMQYLHSYQPPLLHRDLKSPNILLASMNENAPVVAKVSDFGTSMQLFISAFKETSSTRTVTLPTWLAPEVLNEEEFTEKSDIYAYGIILWELITREHPFENYKWMSELEEAIIDGVRPIIPADVPPGFSQLIQDCWQPESALRPSFLTICNRLSDMCRSVAPALKYKPPAATSSAPSPSSVHFAVVLSASERLFMEKPLLKTQRTPSSNAINEASEGGRYTRRSMTTVADIEVPQTPLPLMSNKPELLAEENNEVDDEEYPPSPVILSPVPSPVVN